MRKIAKAGWGLGALLVVAIAGLLFGIVPVPFLMDDGDRPPCVQLSSKASVERALAENRAFAAEIESVPGTDVEVGLPCGDQDRALVSIHVADDEARSAVDLLLQNGSGFGVPAEIVVD